MRALPATDRGESPAASREVGAGRGGISWVRRWRIAGALSLAGALPLDGCSGTGGITWGEEAGGGGANMSQAASMNSAESLATGGVSGQIIGVTVTIINKHAATEQQRRVAAGRAREYVHRVSTRQASPRHHRQHRYLAVDTTPDRRTAPAAKKSVMIFDTEAQQVIGNDVYDVQTPPPIGATARFETYSAQYIGTGS